MSVIQRPEKTSVSGRNIGTGAGVYLTNESGTGIFKSISGTAGISIDQSGSGIGISDTVVSICAGSTSITVSTNTVSKIIKISRTARPSVTAVASGIFNVPVNLRYIFVSGTLTANLPSAIGNGGLSFTIKSTGVVPISCTVSAFGGLIDGSNFKYFNQPYTSITLASDDTNWYIV